MRRILLLLLIGFVVAAPALWPAAEGRAQITAATLQLSERDRDDLKRIERYLTDIRTLRSRFLQVSSLGGAIEGDLYINRPGKLRFEYDEPYPVLLLADGLVLMHFDKELREETYLPLWETPLWFLLRDEVQLDDQVRVVDILRGPASLRVTVEENKDGAQGQVTLVFADQPLTLKKWIITDAQGITTEVALIGPQLGVEIEDELFDRRRILEGEDMERRG